MGIEQRRLQMEEKRNEVNSQGMTSTLVAAMPTFQVQFSHSFQPAITMSICDMKHLFYAQIYYFLK